MPSSRTAGAPCRGGAAESQGRLHAVDMAMSDCGAGFSWNHNGPKAATIAISKRHENVENAFRYHQRKCKVQLSRASLQKVTLSPDQLQQPKLRYPAGGIQKVFLSVFAQYILLACALRILGKSKTCARQKLRNTCDCLTPGNLLSVDFEAA